MSGTEPRWTFETLCSRVALALSVDYEGQPNGQVSDIPNARTIRYYTTLGLLDRPAAFEGRTALYGQRHLMQVTAIKRLQAQGLTLTEVQEQLTGASDAELADWSRVPAAALDEAETAAEAELPAQSAPVRRPFWTAEPAELAPVEMAAPVPRSAPVSPLIGLPLAPGAILLLQGGQTLNDGDWRAVETAAAPLLKVLRQRGLLNDPTLGRTDR